MAITIQNIPFFCLIWIGIGFLFIMIGVLMMASRNEEDYYTVDRSISESSSHIQDLFSYFLEEEEKKNRNLREMVLNHSSQKKEEVVGKENNIKENPSMINSEMIQMYEEGYSIEEIAKKLKKGIGEVNLMISLYTMR
ncbi:hypothetical protein CS063_04210 [Sporanaerobium hydrogeniformans]|uniref:Uncharacterized protein n=1 Tax=Sporanaerobium hydrogeniformans TaxID=3072179 RepID=A0AC61DF04_9FIRM|nr:hypothetical protein [Sporanaerobium hydrogeniformans]PHV71769.1 hypothetical protein CS063_04210 [Sporanaerobium hydrogeniformans]